MFYVRVRIITVPFNRRFRILPSASLSSGTNIHACNVQVYSAQSKLYSPATSTQYLRAPLSPPTLLSSSKKSIHWSTSTRKTKESLHLSLCCRCCCTLTWNTFLIFLKMLVTTSNLFQRLSVSQTTKDFFYSRTILFIQCLVLLPILFL